MDASESVARETSVDKIRHGHPGMVIPVGSSLRARLGKIRIALSIE